jgi:serine/threonine protein kinase
MASSAYIRSCFLLGRGARPVYRGLHKVPGVPSEVVAIKMFRDCENVDSPKLSEADMMLSIPPHPNICRCYDKWIDGCGNGFIAMELIDGKNLKEFLEDVDPDEPIAPLQICEILLQIFSAISHLHEHLIFHGDIKPANIMICKLKNGKFQIKIVDFDQSSYFHSVPQIYQGTPLYSSPEIANAPEIAHAQGASPEIAHAQGDIDSKSDIWAMGPIILHFLTLSEKPWYLKNARNIGEVVGILRTLDFAKTPFPPELLQHEDPNIAFLARIAQNCLALDKSERPSAQDVVAELSAKIAELRDA